MTSRQSDADPAAEEATELEHDFDHPALADRSLDEPHPDRLALDDPLRSEILAAHSAAMKRFQPGYLDPRTGQLVVTAQQLVLRGQCCGLGCRHCPYL